MFVIAITAVQIKSMDVLSTFSVAIKATIVRVIIRKMTILALSIFSVMTKKIGIGSLNSLMIDGKVSY
jgi:hypothetical protein